MENFLLNLTILEKHLDLEDLSSITIMVFSVITVGCIVIINSLLLNYLKSSNSTLINNLIVCDCVVNLANIPTVLNFSTASPTPTLRVWQPTFLGSDKLLKKNSLIP